MDTPADRNGLRLVDRFDRAAATQTSVLDEPATLQTTFAQCRRCPDVPLADCTAAWVDKILQFGQQRFHGRDLLVGAKFGQLQVSAAALSFNPVASDRGGEYAGHCWRTLESSR